MAIATSIWNAGTTGNWDLAANWATGGVPAATHSATIDGTTPETVSITAPETIVALSLADSASTLSNPTVSVNGAGAELVANSIDNDGDLTVDAGTVRIGQHDGVGNYSSTGSVTIQHNGRFGIGGQDSNTGTISFGAGSSNILDIDTAQTAASTIANMTDGDVIALSNGVLIAGNEPSFSNGRLVYTDSSGTYTRRPIG